jgi:hypothetical protein
MSVGLDYGRPQVGNAIHVGWFYFSDHGPKLLVDLMLASASPERLNTAIVPCNSVSVGACSYEPHHDCRQSHITLFSAIHVLASDSVSNGCCLLGSGPTSYKRPSNRMAVIL